MSETRLSGLYIRTGSIPTHALSGGVVSSSIQIQTSLPTGTISSSAQFNVTSQPFTGSFTGSFKGDGSNLTGVTATAIFPTSQVSNVTSTDKFFVSQSSNQYITYGDLLTDLAGTNLAVESSDSLTLATTITGITSITSTAFTGSFTGSLTGALTGTASYASQANTASYALTANSSSFATQANNAANLNNQAASYYLNASNINAGTLGNAYLPSQINVTGITASAGFTGSLTGSLLGTASYASMALTASYALNVPVTASYALTASNIFPAITNNTNNYVLTATGNGTINGESNLAFDGTLLTVTGNATITGDLTVAGTASFTNTDNLTIKDKFILINSGSSALADSGWITQYNAAGSGSAFYLEAGSAGSTGTYGRFAVAYDAAGTSTALTADEFVVTAKTAAGAPATNPTWGGTSNGYGNIYVNSSTGDIFIYS